MNCVYVSVLCMHRLCVNENLGHTHMRMHCATPFVYFDLGNQGDFARL